MDPERMPHEVAEELEALRKAVDGLRAGAAAFQRPEPLPTAHADVTVEAAAHEPAMQELVALGFRSLGYAGQQRKDGSMAVSNWFAHTDGTISGWLGTLKTKQGSRIVMYFLSEAPGPVYCTSMRGGSALSLVRPPFVGHAHYDVEDDLSELLREHRRRFTALSAGAPPTVVATLEQAIDANERFHQARMAWRGSVAEPELLRADLRAVLLHTQRTMRPSDFALIYSEAARWLGVEVPEAGPSFQATSDTPLAGFLSSPPDAPAARRGDRGEESGWLFHCEVPVRGRRLQIADVQMAGNDGEGVVLDVAPGIYAVEARVMTYGIDRRISRVRVYPNGAGVTLGPQAGDVGVDLAAVAICDVDRLAGWAQRHEDDWEEWGESLWYERTAQAGVYPCAPADTVVAFVDSGFGDGTFPVHHLIADSRPVGLEAVFLTQDTPYL